MDSILMVVRNCCTSGNCSTCMADPAHKYGDKVKVVQFLTKNEKMAEQVKTNFAAFGAEIKDSTEEEIIQLEPTSAEWTREKLLKPERINDKLFTKR